MAVLVPAWPDVACVQSHEAPWFFYVSAPWAVVVLVVFSSWLCFCARLVFSSSLRGACLVSLLSLRGRLGLRAAVSSLCSRRGSVSLRRARFFVVVCCFHHMRGFSEHSLRTGFGMRPEVVRSNECSMMSVCLMGTPSWSPV